MLLLCNWFVYPKICFRVTLERLVTDATAKGRSSFSDDPSQTSRGFHLLFESAIVSHIGG